MPTNCGTRDPPLVAKLASCSHSLLEAGHVPSVSLETLALLAHEPNVGTGRFRKLEHVL
jgi:hypothetical protein